MYIYKKSRNRLSPLHEMRTAKSQKLNIKRAFLISYLIPGEPGITDAGALASATNLLKYSVSCCDVRVLPSRISTYFPYAPVYNIQGFLPFAIRSKVQVEKEISLLSSSFLRMALHQGFLQYSRSEFRLLTISYDPGGYLIDNSFHCLLSLCSLTLSSLSFLMPTRFPLGATTVGIHDFNCTVN